MGSTVVGQTNLDESENEDIHFSSPVTVATSSKVEALDFEMVHLHLKADSANSYASISKRIWIGAGSSVHIVMLKAKINLLLPFGPSAILIHYVAGKPGWVFFCSLLGIAALEERIGYVTEQLAFYTGPTVGGLLNATFLNATEMIISIYALKKGMLRVVQQSLLGSILLNMLLQLGWAFFTGGIIYYTKTVQFFNKEFAIMSSGLLLMAVTGIMFPAVLHYTQSEVYYGKSELAVSRFCSCVMLVAYASYLFFQISGHHNLYHSPIDEQGDKDEGSKEEDVPEITKWEAIGWLALLTVWVSILSEYLVNAIQGASDSFNMPVSFISIILLPIAGNDITLGVAIGSSTNISMFVIPFCVIVGWIMGTPMDLNFQLFETAILFITVLVVAFMLQEGKSNYLKGLMLILCYLIVAASFFVHVDP